MIDSLKLPDEAATAIVALGIEFETYSDEMPESQKDRLEAAHEMVTYAIDAYKEEGIRSDSDNEDKAEAGEQVEAILKVAGVKVDDDGDIDYAKAMTGARLEKLLGKFDLEMDGDEADDDEEDDDDEAAFDINDIIDNYDDLSPASKIKAIKKLKLDVEDDDDVEKLNAIADYEEDQDKPTSRVVSYIEELLGEEDEDEDEPEEEEEPEVREQYSEKQLLKMEKDDLKDVYEELEIEEPPFPKRFTPAGKKRVIAAILEAYEGDEGEEEADDEQEPWDGYDDMSVVKIKKALKQAAADDDLDEDQIAMVTEYEEANENRSAILDLLKELGESEEEEKPAKARSSRRRSRSSADPDDNDDADDAVARDDEKEKASKRSKKSSNGVITLTREQILTALDSGEVMIEV